MNSLVKFDFLRTLIVTVAFACLWNTSVGFVIWTLIMNFACGFNILYIYNMCVFTHVNILLILTNSQIFACSFCLSSLMYCNKNPLPCLQESLAGIARYLLSKLFNYRSAETQCKRIASVSLAHWSKLEILQLPPVPIQNKCFIWTHFDLSLKQKI